MRSLFLLVILWAGPRSEVVLMDRVDEIEVNSFYDDKGDLVFTQCIFFDLPQDGARHSVVDWRLVKGESQYPARDWGNGGYVVRWADGETLREVRAGSVSYTFTQYDTELIEREFLPKEKRRELRAPKPKKR